MRDRVASLANPLILRIRLPEPNRVLRAALFAILGALLVSGLAWRWSGVDALEYLAWLPGCAFRAWTGFPCPGCGMGHALIHLSRLEWLAAVSANPSAPFLALAMSAGAFRRAPDRAVCEIDPRLAAVGLAIVLASWLWRSLPIAGALAEGA